MRRIEIDPGVLQYSATQVSSHLALQRGQGGDFQQADPIGLELVVVAVAGQHHGMAQIELQLEAGDAIGGGLKAVQLQLAARHLQRQGVVAGVQHIGAGVIAGAIQSVFPAILDQQSQLTVVASGNAAVAEQREGISLLVVQQIQVEEPGLTVAVGGDVVAGGQAAILIRGGEQG